MDKDEQSASLLDGEDVVGQNVDGYDIYRSSQAEDVGATRTEAELEPLLLATVVASEHRDPDTAAVGECLFYCVRTRSNRGGIPHRDGR